MINKFDQKISFNSISKCIKILVTIYSINIWTIIDEQLVRILVFINVEYK
jgi:hypothetical protein